MNILGRWVRKRIFGIDDRDHLEILKDEGLEIGENVDIHDGCIIDPSHCWLISIGNNVTLAPRVHILAHDASTKRALDYTMVGRTIIGNNVFIGANTTILPGVTIGNNVIIGAGSIVTTDIPNDSVAVGNPSKVVKSYDDFLEEKKILFGKSNIFDESYRIGNIDKKKKEEMKQMLKRRTGFIK